MTKYDRNGASSRYRSFQYFLKIKNSGLKYEVFPLFNEQYLVKKYKNRRTPFLLVLYLFIRRLLIILRLPSHSIVVIEYELMPFFPAIFEWLLHYRGCKLIIDYDDAVFHRYDRHKNSLVRIFFQIK